MSSSRQPSKPPNDWRRILLSSLIFVPVNVAFSAAVFYPLWIAAQPRLVAPAPENKPQHAVDKTAEIEVLIKDRCDLLEKVVAILTDLYKAGLAHDFSELGKAQRDALRATLDLNESPEKRKAALENLQNIADHAVKIAESRRQANLASELEVFQAKAILLEVRVEILRGDQKAESRR
jgi:hypothetical protein